MSRTCDVFPNATRADYRRYAVHPIGTRKSVAAIMADLTLDYYSSIHVGGDGRLPIQRDYDRLERLADFILAEDHAAGLSILRDPYDVPRDQDIYVPPGAGAVAYMRKYGVTLACPADAEPLADGKLTKICKSCGYVFEDNTKPKMQSYCGPSCRRIYQRLWMRKRRNGTTALEGERRRQTHEYGFYSPAEMRALESRSEQPRGDYDDIGRAYAAKKRKEKHGTRNAATLIDRKGTEQNGNLDGQYRWTSGRNAWKNNPQYIWNTVSVWWGPVTSYNVKDQPLTEKFQDAKFSCQHLRLLWEGN